MKKTDYFKFGLAPNWAQWQYDVGWIFPILRKVSVDKKFQYIDIGNRQLVHVCFKLQINENMYTTHAFRLRNQTDSKEKWIGVQMRAESPNRHIDKQRTFATFISFQPLKYYAQQHSSNHWIHTIKWMIET